MAEASGLLQKLSLESLPKTYEAEGPAKQAPGIQNGSISGGAPDASSPSKLSSNSVLPEFVDSRNCYLPGYAPQIYFYGGYDRGTGNWGNYSRYANQDGQEVHVPRPNGIDPSPPAISRMYQSDRFYGGSGHGNGFRYGYWDLIAERSYKPQGQRNGSFGYVSRDGFIELNRGPRAGRLNQKVPRRSLPTTATESQNLSLRNMHLKVHLDGEQYNREDFPDKYSQAKFFIIKSYSEDHIHRSIKYNVWVSTPNGNKKLDVAYTEAQEKTGGCPVFLFFSANSSGQFVGVAEMVGPVDFNKTVEYWRQDKWTGCFPVKWHIIKDVPNSILKHITLENNENKPVTNSRDTQEVNLEQGLQMIKIFKEHVSSTSILDDFEFYEYRQSSMQEKKTKQQLQKQDWAGKASHAPVPVEGEREIANEMHPFQWDSALHEAQEHGISAVASDADVKKTAVEKHCVDGAANGVGSGS